MDIYMLRVCVCGPFKEDRQIITLWSSLEKAHEALGRFKQAYKYEFRSLIYSEISKVLIDNMDEGI